MKKIFTKKRNLVLTISLVLFSVLLLWRIIQAFEIKNDDNVREINSTALNLSEYNNNNSNLEFIGQVESIEKIDIKSETSGQIKKLNVKIGDKVKIGDILMELDHAILDSQLAQARAGIDRMKNNLELKMAGATNESIEQSKAQIEKVKTAVESQISQAKNYLEIAENKLRILDDEGNSEIIRDSYENLINTIRSSMVALDSARESSNKILKIDNDSGDNKFKNVLSVLDFSKLIEAEKSYLQLNSNIESLKLSTKDISLNSPYDEILRQANAVKDSLILSQSHLSDMEAVLNASISSADLSQAELDATKGNINNIRNMVAGANNNMNNAIQGIGLSESNYASLQIAYEKAKNDYNNTVLQGEKEIALSLASHNLLTASPRDIDLNGLRANIREAEAAYNIINENRKKTIIRAPFDAVVTSLPFDSGDYVGHSALLASLLSDKGLQIKTFVNSSDISMIKKGQEVSIEKNTAKGIVDRLAPSVNAKTKKVEVIVLVSEGKENLIVGQHVNIKINVIQDKDNLNSYFLPLSAIKTTKDGSFVYTLKDGKAESLKIETGQVVGDKIEVFNLKNDDIILSSIKGINNGDKINIQ